FIIIILLIIPFLIETNSYKIDLLFYKIYILSTILNQSHKISTKIFFTHPLILTTNFSILLLKIFVTFRPNKITTCFKYGQHAENRYYGLLRNQLITQFGFSRLY